MNEEGPTEGDNMGSAQGTRIGSTSEGQLAWAQPPTSYTSPPKHLSASQCALLLKNKQTNKNR